jgi:hypothetical protein
VQDSSVISNAWPVSYETVASSSSAVERRAPSPSELTLIRSLRDQLKNTQHQLPAAVLTWILIMLLVKPRLIVSPDRLSPRVIVRGRIRASRRTDLAEHLNLAYLLCMYVSWEARRSALCKI